MRKLRKKTLKQRKELFDLYPFHGGQDTESLKAVAAAEVGKPVARCSCDPHLFGPDAEDMSNFIPHRMDLIFKVGAFPFDRDREMRDGLLLQCLQRSLEIDLRIGDPIFAAKILCDPSQNRYPGNGSNGIANGMIDDIAVGICIEAWDILENDPPDDTRLR